MTTTATAVDVRPVPTVASRRTYPWVVFALSFALLLSDYMSRQVLSAVFPLLKVQWGLSDAQLGALTGIVALAVGVLAVPLSLLADRWGRVRAVVAMAVLWSVATAASALAANYGQLMLGRLFIGVGEAAYGSVGLAVVLAVFPRQRRSQFTGAFMAGGLFGAVAGVAAGGALAARFGWRWSFAAMAVLGLVLVGLYRLAVSERRLAAHQVADPEPTVRQRSRLKMLFGTPCVLCAYVASGLQLFVAASLTAWLPSYLNRSYHLATGKAAGVAAVFILIMAVGMIACGGLTDRWSRGRPVRKWTTSIGYAGGSLALLGTGFALAPGRPQLLLLAVGAFFAAGTAGPAGAVVANLTDPSIRATALGTLTLANNLLGLAIGPVLTGVLADHLGLSRALALVPLVSVGAIAALLLGRRTYPGRLDASA